MISIRHTGVYVDNLDSIEDFYRQVFEMIPICSKEPDHSALFDELIGIRQVEILTSKLVTPYGKKMGQGDMLELVKVNEKDFVQPSISADRKIYLKGTSHLAFETEDIFETVRKIEESGGKKETEIYQMQNGNHCCFCTDPENNWLELIQRKK